ncbi:DUF481 domain-containing protein [Vreelandella arcis]|uniref:Putative salt-induced outer membrane protein n=1 Tax=Vreelandella arcis TaxID=416873 RepID=A0A1G9XHY0_9GAMM|nr:DUF481 domain-containing protein [Halomonas arcis]SDM96317.1 putative salt-induced outer membrane protein [Halomonas arcis]
MLAKEWPVRGAIVIGALWAAPAVASPFYAPPPPAEDTPMFSGDIEFGYNRLTGNTNSETLISKARLQWLTGNVTHSLRSDVRHVSKEGDTSTEQYLIAGRERYDFSGPHYLFGFARWEKDRFAGYDQQLTAIGGYGRQLLDNDRHTLSLEAGPGYRDDRLREHGDEQLGVAYTAFDYHWSFSDYADIRQEVSLEYTRQNVTSRSLTALTAPLNAKLSLRLSHELKHNSEPPQDAEKNSDTTTSASVLYHW